MLLQDACHSLRLECALREVGFVEIGWKTVAHAGIYFIEPIGMRDDAGPDDRLLGFVLERHLLVRQPDDVRMLFASAKHAFDMSEMILDWG
jgi:hypothetical protein